MVGRDPLVAVCALLHNRIVAGAAAGADRHGQRAARIGSLVLASHVPRELRHMDLRGKEWAGTDFVLALRQCSCGAARIRFDDHVIRLTPEKVPRKQVP